MQRDVTRKLLNGCSQSTKAAPARRGLQLVARRVSGGTFPALTRGATWMSSRLTLRLLAGTAVRAFAAVGTVAALFRPLAGGLLFGRGRLDRVFRHHIERQIDTHIGVQFDFHGVLAERLHRREKVN